MDNKSLVTKQKSTADEQLKLFKNRKVVQLNEFIKGDVSAFTVNDLKIFKLIISKVDSQETLFKDFYEINTDEIKALNINEKHLYKETRKSLKRLANIYVTFEENNSIREVGLIRNDFKFEKYSKVILINFNDDMSEYLINLKKSFFMYDLIDIINFKFKHTIKFYEYIKSKSLNVIKLKVDTIKRILGLENKYVRYTNFKKDVLEVIKEEINISSNTLYITYTEEKIGSKVENIIFHIKRIDREIVLKSNTNNEEVSIFKGLIGKRCRHLDNDYLLRDVHIDDKIVILKEVDTDNITKLICITNDGLEEMLKKLFPDEYKVDLSEIESPEISNLLLIKDFKKFKQEVINQYTGKELANNVPGFEEDVIISIQNDTGYLVESSKNRVISKEESLVIWKYLYNNKNLIGKIEHKNFTNVFLNKIIHIYKNNKNDERELFKYMISDIKEEQDGHITKYRIYIQDIQNPLQDVEKSKTLLTLEQLKLFIEENTKE